MIFFVKKPTKLAKTERNCIENIKLYVDSWNIIRARVAVDKVATENHLHIYWVRLYKFIVN